jgi:hypothetical protein
VSQPVHFIRHARNRLRRLKLDQHTVIGWLVAPEVVTPSDAGRLNAWKHTERGWFRITYQQESQGLVVITVTHRRHGPPDREGTQP